jgi:hypothetical protein
MRSGFMMILKIARQDAAQVTLAEDDNVIQAFTADRTDQMLDICPDSPSGANPRGWDFRERQW